MLHPFFLLISGWKMYKSCMYVSKKKYVWNLYLNRCPSIEIYFFESVWVFFPGFFFFSRFSNSASSHTEPRSLSKNCKASAPQKRKDTSWSQTQSHWRIYNFLEGGGGLQPLSTNLSTIMISVRKAGLGATLQYMAQNGSFRIISPTRGGGGTSTTLPLEPPMKPVTNVCAENFPLRVVQ